MIAQSVAKFSADLASGKPAPGGGAAAALTCSLGAGLYVMALQIAARRQWTAADKREIRRVRSGCEKERKAFLKLVDHDARAYLALVRAWKVRSEISPQKLQQCRRGALQVPLEICRRSAQALRQEPVVRRFAGKMLASDVTAGSALLAGGFAAATATAAANLEALGNTRQAAVLHRELEQLTKDLSCRQEF
ncbi:MAG: cyclodeaminase/cyclohydrolase family protein [Candidatus Omnitrophica bacterium]|nr:cyclodeaminase/cyclohydrolase family protein [Candidatus Omnitrophota bacterium]